VESKKQQPFDLVTIVPTQKKDNQICSEGLYQTR
jgi:hypothetical protein